MNTERSWLDKRVSRRGVIKTSGVVASGIALFQLRQGITLNPYNYNVNLDDGARHESERLSGKSSITIAHRAGNSPEQIVNAAKAGLRFAEGDVNKSGGQLYMDHGINAGLKHVTLGGFDRETLTLRLGPPSFGVKDAFQIASASGIGLFLELKRGSYSPQDIEKIIGLSRDNNVPTYLYSRNFDTVDMVRHTSQDPQHCVYVPDGPKQWNKIFQEQDREQRCAFLTNAWSAVTYYDGLAKIKQSDRTVVVMDVVDPRTAVYLNTNGVVNGFFNETKVLEGIIG